VVERFTNGLSAFSFSEASVHIYLGAGVNVMTKPLSPACWGLRGVYRKRAEKLSLISRRCHYWNQILLWFPSREGSTGITVSVY